MPGETIPSAPIKTNFKVIDCKFENHITKPAINFQVYNGDIHSCDEVTIQNNDFDNCRQAIKFEGCFDSDSGQHGDELIMDPDDVVATLYNIWIRECTFDIEDVYADGTNSKWTPMAIWIESQGIYNVLVENCQINGTGNVLIDPESTGNEINFRNGIVLDLKTDPTLCSVNVAVKLPDPVPIPPGPASIKDVYDNGILIMTNEDAKLVTKLNSSRFPNKNDKGLNRLDIHGCVTGSGIKVVSNSSYTNSRFKVFNSEIHDNDSGTGVDIFLNNESHLDVVMGGNKIYDNGNGGVNVVTSNGSCELTLSGNEIHDTAQSPNQGGAGVHLLNKPLASPSTASILGASLKNNRIHHMKGYGLYIHAQDDGYLSDQLHVVSTSDRLYHNESHGVFIEGTMQNPNASLDVDLAWLTSCDNSSGGICFENDFGQYSVDVVNAIFWDNNPADGDVNLGFTGTISYSDWGTGLDGGGGGINHPNSIDSDPLFADALYHLMYDPNDPFNRSPCVDKGYDDAFPEIVQDMEGDDRRIDVDPNPTKTDMGSDEHDPNG